jgi:hypothetical protein
MPAPPPPTAQEYAQPYPLAPGPVSTFPPLLDPSAPLPGELVSLGALGDGLPDNRRKLIAWAVCTGIGVVAARAAVKNRSTRRLIAKIPALGDRLIDNPTIGGATAGAALAALLVRSFPGFYATPETGAPSTPSKGRASATRGRIRQNNVQDARLVASTAFSMAGRIPQGQTIQTFAVSPAAPWASQRTVPTILLTARNAIRGTPGDEYIRSEAEKYAIAFEGWGDRGGRSVTSYTPPTPDQPSTGSRLRRGAIIAGGAGLVGLGSMLAIGIPAAVLVAVLVARSRARS